jgi:hypothetical protein
MVHGGNTIDEKGDKTDPPGYAVQRGVYTGDQFRLGEWDTDK